MVLTLWPLPHEQDLGTHHKNGRTLETSKPPPQSAEIEVQRWETRLSQNYTAVSITGGTRTQVTWFPELYTISYQNQGERNLREYLVHPSDFMKFI